MKKTTIFSTLIVISVLFQTSIIATPAFDDEVIKEDRQVEDFHGIKNTGSVDVYIKQGSEANCVIEANKDIIDKIETGVKDGILEISVKDLKGFKLFQTAIMKAYVTVRNLKTIRNTGSGDLTTENKLTAKSLEISNTGSGDLDIKLEGASVNVDLTGSGDLDISGIRSNFGLSINGSSDVKADDLEVSKCSVEINGSGNADLSGSTVELVIDNSASGDIDAGNLTTENASIKMSGSGNSRIHASKTVDVRLYGSGDLRYKGDPEFRTKVKRGSGDIIRE